MTEPLFKKILVPVDLGDSSIAPLHYAGLLARQFDSEVTLMYADELASLFRDFDPEFIAYPVQPAEDAARDENAVRDFAARHLTGVAAPPIVVIPGHPVASIVRVAKEQNADLIIMGTHGRRGWWRALAGSVADGVVRGASQPVLVVPAQREGRPYPEGIRRVICPVNFTDAARDAVEYACTLASAFESELVLVHVQESGDVDSQVIHDRFREWLPDARRTPCSFREVVLRVGPAERVLDCVEDVGADLLVMGAQVKWLRAESIIGTTAERLLRFSPVPILTVKRKAVAPEEGNPAEEALAKSLA
jgi:nucleotide-binding universal stress UspA family protein